LYCGWNLHLPRLSQLWVDDCGADDVSDGVAMFFVASDCGVVMVAFGLDVGVLGPLLSSNWLTLTGRATKELLLLLTLLEDELNLLLLTLMEHSLKFVSCFFAGNGGGGGIFDGSVISLF
jgi:hypothetical protein